jgi:choline dehydrogenase-like flavoprotein
MAHGVMRLRELLSTAEFGRRRAPEVYPGSVIEGDQLKDHIRSNCGTAYHPVSTLRMGDEAEPVTPELKLRNTEALWVADASIMPQVTSANTNAPSMMIGWKGAEFIADQVS